MNLKGQTIKRTINKLNEFYVKMTRSKLKTILQKTI